MTLLEQLKQSAAYLQQVWNKDHPTLAIVLGSGFRAFTDKLDVLVDIPLADVPHCQSPRVEAHGSSLLLARHENRLLAVMTGRLHMYEGYTAAQVCYPLRALAHAGVRSVILTNAAGGLKAELNPGDVLVLEDQINLTGQTCLDSAAAALGPRFVDMIDCFQPAWRTAVLKACPQTRPGIYLGVLGAAYETPAETAFFATTGANAVGMSTVQEVIAARQLAMNVLGLSFVTNLAGGLSSEVSHADVIRIGIERAPELHRILAEAIRLAP